MSLQFTVAPHSAWANRLRGAGCALEFSPGMVASGAVILQTVTAETPFAKPDRAPNASAEADAWDSIEHGLWNHLLPWQRATGRFEAPGTTHSRCAEAMTTVLSNSIALRDRTLQVALPIGCAGACCIDGATIGWSLRTGYPQAGWINLTLRSTRMLEMGMQVRIPSPGRNVQVLINGAAEPYGQAGSAVRLAGPWHDGDNIMIRFGLPFAVVGPGRRSIDRSFPGAPPVEAVALRHGIRELARVDTASDGSAELPDSAAGDATVAVGVRKDGALLLNPDDCSHGSPFETSGDFYRSADDPPQLLVARELLSSIPGLEVASGNLSVRFRPFETTFDFGA